MTPQFLLTNASTGLSVPWRLMAWQGVSSATRVQVLLSYNNITSGGVAGIFTSCTSLLNLYVDVSDNNLTVLPANLFAAPESDSYHSNSGDLQIEADFSRNPLLSMDTEVFSGPDINRVSGLSLHLRDVEDGFTLTHQAQFNFSLWTSNTSTLTLEIVSKNMVVETVNSVATFLGQTVTISITQSNLSYCPHVLPRVPFQVLLDLSNNFITSVQASNFRFNGTVNLANNQLTYLDANTFVGSNLVSANVSHNVITAINVNAFDYSISLLSLDFSFNNLTYIPENLGQQSPNLNKFIVHNNKILALPSNNSRIFEVSDATDNVLLCSQYGPELDGVSAT